MPNEENRRILSQCPKLSAGRSPLRNVSAIAKTARKNTGRLLPARDTLPFFRRILSPTAVQRRLRAQKYSLAWHRDPARLWKLKLQAAGYGPPALNNRELAAFQIKANWPWTRTSFSKFLPEFTAGRSPERDREHRETVFPGHGYGETVGRTERSVSINPLSYNIESDSWRKFYTKFTEHKYW